MLLQNVVMNPAEQQARLEEAFERIEETILPCIAMMLETLLDASAGAAETDPKALAAELRTLAAELEELTRTVERSSPVHLDPGEYRTAAG
jgi:DNA mismatch repair protein MutH